MGRRRKKKQDTTEAMVQLLLLGLAGIGWYFTRDITSTVVIVIVGLTIFIGIQYYKRVKYISKLRKSGIHEIDSMDGVQFEYYLRELFKTRGYKVEMTKAVGDFGADLILVQQDKRIVVQAKRYSKAVGIKAVQEVISSVNMYNATDAWVVTNNTFTKAAIELAGKNQVTLIGRNELIDFISALEMKPNPVTIKKSVTQNTRKNCPDCGSALLIRKGQKKQEVFLGCSSYPKCTYTKKTV